MLPAKYWFPLGIALGISAAILGVSEQSYRSLTDSRLEAAQGKRLQALLLELNIDVLEAGSAQLRYLVTRRIEYVAPYREAVKELRPLREELRDLAAGDKAIRERLAELDALVTIELAELQRTFDRADAGDFEGALALVAGAEGRVPSQGIEPALRATLAAAEDAATRRALAWEASLEKSRSGILAVAGLNAALVALLTLLLIRDTRRAREGARLSASYAARLETEVAERTSQISSLSVFLQSQAEDDRARMAHEMHDELSSILTPVRMDVTWLQGRIGKNPEVAARLARLATLLDSGIDVKRGVIEKLRPSLLDHLGLASAVRWYVEESCRTHSLGCHLEFAADVGRLSPELEIAFYRVAQESVSNVFQHAKAKNLWVTLERSGTGIVLCVRDDGVGLRDLFPSGPDMHGISGMRQRLASVGGTLDLDAAPEGGTRVRAWAPQLTAEVGAAG